MKLFYPLCWVLSMGAGLFLSAPVETGEVLLDNRPDYSTCINSYDAGMQTNGQQSIRFYNGCGERLYMNVCVQDRSGETKLYQSGRTVPAYGNYTISTMPFSTPQKISWNAAPYTPQVPDLCRDS